MARLVEDLLLARVDDAGMRVRREDIDLDDLAYAERERITVEHPRLTVDTTIEPVRVEGDVDALQRVLRNLVDNAARHAAGLGLPIARDIVTAHGGELTVAGLDTGAATQITLPLPGAGE